MYARSSSSAFGRRHPSIQVRVLQAPRYRLQVEEVQVEEVGGRAAVHVVC